MNKVYLVYPKPRYRYAGGITKVGDSIYSYLIYFRHKFLDLVFINSLILEAPNRPTGIVSPFTILNAFLIMFKLMRIVFWKRRLVIHFHSAGFGLFLLKDLLIVAVAKLIAPRNRFIVHLHYCNISSVLPQNKFAKSLVLRFFNSNLFEYCVLSSLMSTQLKMHACANTVIHHFPSTYFGSHDKVLERDFSLLPPLRLIFIGSLDKRKGIEDLLQVCLRLPSSSFHLDVLGNSHTRDYMEKLINLVTGPLRQNFTFHGYQSPERVSELIKLSHALVLPSYGEGSPLVIQEALHMGVPVLASRVGAISEVIIDNYNGFVFEPGDLDHLHSLLIYLHNNPGELYRLISNLCNNSDSFTQQSYMEKLASIWSE